MRHAQDLSNPIGKIHRVNDDGSVPRDNPFVSRPDAVPTIWSYGHRNPQGLAWDPQSGRLWESEHGPNAGDEINIIERGRNYGWGVVTRGRQPGITKTSEPGMVDPVVYYIPTFAPSGISFYSGIAIRAGRTPVCSSAGLRAGAAAPADRRRPCDRPGSHLRPVRPRPRCHRGSGRLSVSGAAARHGCRHELRPRRAVAGLVVRMVPVTP